MKETKSPIVPRLKPKLPALWKRCSKEEFMDLIDKKMGVVTSCCNELDCTFTQFYSAVKHWNLQEHLTNAKEALTSLAEHSLVECLKSTDEKVKLQAALGALRLAVQKNQTFAQKIQIDSSDPSKVNIQQIFGFIDVDDK